MERIEGLFRDEPKPHVMRLYDHQLTANREVWRNYNAVDSVLLQASTGAGKTVCAAHMAKMRHIHCGSKTLFMAHRREIVTQAEKTMREAADLSTSIVMAGHRPNPYATVHVASIDTLRRRDLPEVGTVIFDEGHRIGGATYDAVFKHYKALGAKIMVLTATPMRTDGKGLAAYADKMVRMPEMRWLIANGFLVQPKYKVGDAPELKGVKTTAGDYNQHDIEAVMMGKKLVGNVVENYLAFARHRRSMMFTNGVKHSIYLVDKLKDAGIKAVHIDGTTEKDVRDRAKAMMEDGSIDLISNAQVYIEGTDIPCIDCIVDASATKSLTKFLQAGGRGMRTFLGKDHLLYLDHSGNLARHGRLELPRDWELTEGKEQVEKFEQERKNSEKAQIKCQNCGFLLTSAKCGECGLQFVPQGKDKDFLPGVLVDMPIGEYEAIQVATVAKPKKSPKAEPTPADKERWYSELLGVAENLGERKGWDGEKKEKYAQAKFKAKFDQWPYKKQGVIPQLPGDEVLRWIRHQNIAYAKGMEKAKTSQPWGNKFARSA